MKAILLLLCLCYHATAQTLRWTAPLPEPSFPADAGAFFSACQGDAAGNVAAVVSYSKIDGINQPFSGTKVFWFTNLGKPIHTDEFLAATVSDLRIVNVSATILLLALYDANGSITLRKYTKRRTGVTFIDTAFPAHEAHFSPPQLDRAGFFLCEKVNNRPAVLKRYIR